MTEQKTTLPAADLDDAYSGSYFTIFGAGGDLSEWAEGLTEMLEEKEIGTPAGFVTTTGGDINRFASQRGMTDEDVEFNGDLTVLMFPLSGLHAGRLAMFKLAMGARWFDDVIDNMVG